MASPKKLGKLLVPVWTPGIAQMNNAMALQVLARLGVTDLASYFRRLWIAIAMGVVIGAVVGATYWGIQGLLIGTAVGIASPALLIWLVITAAVIFVHLFVFIAAWTVIVYCALYVIRWWL
jgi:hypothetical protein